LLQSGASLGAVLTPLYVLLVRELGGSWPVVFWTVGAIGLLWVPLWMSLVKRGDLDGVPPATADSTPPQGWRVVGRMITLFVMVICISVSWQFLRAWLPKYLKEFRGYSPAASGFTVAGYYLAADVGCILSGFVVLRLTRHGWHTHTGRVVAFAGCCALTALATLVPMVGNTAMLPVVLMLVGAGILGLHPHYYALTQELPTRWMGLLSGTLAASSWFVVGIVQKELGDHIKTTNRYDEGFVLAGLAPLVALVVLGVLWRPAKAVS
jgi:ACS family hexuronate transporter-like MFS transporter